MLVNNSSRKQCIISIVNEVYGRFVRQQLMLAVNTNSSVSKDQNSLFKRNVKLISLLINQEDQTNASLQICLDWAKVTTKEIFEWLRFNDESELHDDQHGLCGKLKVIIAKIKKGVQYNENSGVTYNWKGGIPK